MIVGAAADDAETVSFHALSEGLGIANDLALIFFKRRLQRFLETDRLRGDDVHQGTTLNSRERLRVNFLRVLFFAQDESPARSTESLVRGRGHKISMCNRTGMQACNDEAGDVRDVRQQTSSDCSGDFAHAREINNTRICAGADGDHFWFMLAKSALICW